MNFHYKFSSEAKQDFLEFLKVSEEQNNNPFCNLQEYESSKRFFRLTPETTAELENYKSKRAIVYEISDSDEEVAEATPQTQSAPEENATIQETSTFDDITDSIKESLDVDKPISPFVLNNLENQSDKLENVFKTLASELNLEAVINFGISLIESTKLVRYYIRYLLLNSMKLLEYSDNLQEILEQYFRKHPTELVQELSSVLLDGNNESSRIVLQYIDKLTVDCKSTLFREFIFNCNQLLPSYISVIEILLNAQTEPESMHKLIEVMSIFAGDFKVDKSFGKLIITVIQTLGSKVLQFDRPLKHIIGTHSSIWKAKVQKTFDACFDDSLSLSQF